MLSPYFTPGEVGYHNYQAHLNGADQDSLVGVPVSQEQRQYAADIDSIAFSLRMWKTFFNPSALDGRTEAGDRRASGKTSWWNACARMDKLRGIFVSQEIPTGNFFSDVARWREAQEALVSTGGSGSFSFGSSVAEELQQRVARALLRPFSWTSGLSDGRNTLCAVRNIMWLIWGKAQQQKQ